MRVYTSCDKLMDTYTEGTLCVFVNRWRNAQYDQVAAIANNNNTHELTVHLSLYIVDHVTKSNGIKEYLVLCAELDRMRREAGEKDGVKERESVGEGGERKTREERRR